MKHDGARRTPADDGHATALNGCNERLGRVGRHLRSRARRARRRRVETRAAARASTASCWWSPVIRGRSAAASSRRRATASRSPSSRSTGSTASRPRPIEVERDEASVTADTLEALSAPGRELFLVLGADAVANMGTWRRLDETRDLATVVVVERPGDVHAEPPGPGWRVERVSVPRLDIVVDRPARPPPEGRPIDGLVPAGRRARDPAGGASTLTRDDPRCPALDPSPDSAVPGSDGRCSTRHRGPGSRRTRPTTRRAPTSSCSTSATSSGSPRRSCS